MKAQKMADRIIVVIPWVLTILYLYLTYTPTTVWIGKVDGFWVMPPESSIISKTITNAFLFVCIGCAYAAGAADAGVERFNTRKGIVSTALWVVLMIVTAN